MKLKLLNFWEHLDTPHAWTFNGLALRDRNLIVGVNASGKSRTIKSIELLSALLSKRLDTSTFMGHLKWKATFHDDDGNGYIYSLEIAKSLVVLERFSKGGDVLLERVSGNTSTIQMMQTGGLFQDNEFRIPDTELAAPSKMDLIQTPYLEPLIQWAKSVFYYRFGTTLGQGTLGLKQKGLNIDQLDHDQEAFLPKFAAGVEKFPGFLGALKGDMKRMGYEIEDAMLLPTSSITNAPVGLVSLAVKEADLNAPTEHTAMSQGMFRAWSLLIQANYLAFSKKCGCLMIDDIGEGLDFERSCILIDLLSEKSRFWIPIGDGYK